MTRDSQCLGISVLCASFHFEELSCVTQAIYTPKPDTAQVRMIHDGDGLLSVFTRRFRKPAILM